ncbi:MAG TPA: SUMF1/EgtB/PvdO family nonheme iron enzyme [Candidatus Limnocylindrales bacterium]|nr:SUMF1/EgtB/PvdO family nonheme iron enzyme [Candidatus Limnocylindrales bacterium]
MKTRLHALWIGLALIAGVHPALATLTLSITLTNSQALLYWPSNATTYALQSSINLASTNWVFVMDAIPAAYGSDTALTVTNASTARFFRLISLPATTSDGMALVPAGSFTIGNFISSWNGDVNTNDPDITDANPTNVYVSAFYMDTNLVTSNQWATVSAYATNHGYSFDFPGAGKAANQPEQTQTWSDAVKWINARSQQAGLTPVYYTDAGLTQVYTNGGYSTIVYANWTANGYRLPTEAEWEKAARGGLSGQRFPWGNTISETQANYDSSSSLSYDLGPSGYNPIGNYPATSPGTSPVGSFAANGYGLYDMAGNVMEWCWDWYAGTPYPTGSPYSGGNDPRGPASGAERVLRGGGWPFNVTLERCAAREGGFGPGDADNFIGFRCVRGL